MAMRKIEATVDVVTAARKRILNVFSNGVPVYLSFSAGKDSLCMSHLVYDLAIHGQIDPKQIVVIFIDEEAIYPSMEQMAQRWRKRFLSIGSEFRWYCLPLRQVSSLHHLQNNEQWITWEPGKETDWVRQPPPFAIRSSPYLNYVGEMNYQTFTPLVTKDGIQLIGVRASESIQRAQYISKMNMSKNGITGKNSIYPIYDWKDCDVWLYIKEHHLDFPDSYIDLYRAGVQKNRLRLSNFFGADSIAGLRFIAETDHNLWERIERREPNAYLTLLYWDSELFKRSTRKRKAMEGDTGKDYKAILEQMLFREPEKYFTNPGTQRTAAEYRKFFVKNSIFMEKAHFRRMHDALIAGDPKLRSLRALYSQVFGDYADYSRSTSAIKGVRTWEK